MNLKNYEIVILDCDGVIFDSNSLKINAFRSVLVNFDKILVDSFIKHLRNNFGTSRFHLIKVFIEDFLKEKKSNKLFDEILDDYCKECVKLYGKAKFTTKLIEFLEHYRGKSFFVASGSDETELKNVFKDRKLDKYFIDIYGSPTNKNQIVNNILLQGRNAVLIGDSKSDLLAAQENNINFIFMSEYTTSEEMMEIKNLNTIFNLGDLI